MTNFNKMRKAEKFETIASLLENAEMVDFLLKEAESVNNRNANKHTSPSAIKKQAEAEALRNQIREILACSEKPLQCKNIGEMLGISASKVSAHLRYIPEAKRTEVKRVTYFSI